MKKLFETKNLSTQQIENIIKQESYKHSAANKISLTREEASKESRIQDLQYIKDFFENIDDVKSGLNNILQENFSKALNDFGRFIFNTTFGIFGLFDVATPMGFDKNDEDFGQTLGKWGVEPGPYIVLPFLGPTTVRDGLSRGIDSVISPLAVADDHPTTSGLLTGLNILNQTTVLLELDNFVSGDKYIFFRDAYLQRRKYEISDGEIDADDFVDEFEDF